MQEDGLTSLQANKEGIKQLHHLGKREKHHPQPRRTITVDKIGRCADSLLEGMCANEPQQMGHHANGTEGRVDGQEQIPVGKALPQLDRAVLEHAGHESNHGDVKGEGDIDDPPVALHKFEGRAGVEVFLEGGVELLGEGEELPELCLFVCVLVCICVCVSVSESVPGRGQVMGNHMVFVGISFKLERHTHTHTHIYIYIKRCIPEGSYT